MAGLCLKTVTLVFFLSAGSLAAVDQNTLAVDQNTLAANQDTLAGLILAVKDRYLIKGMFSLALSIQSKNQNLEQIFKDNPVNKVTDQLSKGLVYRGKRLAVAKVKKPEHAELRLLTNLSLVSKKGDLLVIYSYASSCSTSCTVINGPYNIIKKINNVIDKGNWSKYAFVFEKVFSPKNKTHIEKCFLRKALKDLGTSRITLANIFRCYVPNKANSSFQCTSCSSDGGVTEACIDYEQECLKECCRIES
ncbi:uncharacterized protein LOC129096365 [Anoplopoma fimbria]|uniref:uncharacterized protein LOC129096365 n=1 Tax=Anoplopoma fimbria TaxID=229290 RepID=UPI0023EB7D8A|nr:uncharacterized protein LOC129096365 [Anoplopoma fimbria]